MSNQQNNNQKQQNRKAKQVNKNVFEIIKQTLREDGGFYVSVLGLFGYLFTTVQMIVRYTYYGVELTYLLYIKLEDILLGLNYIIIMSLTPILAYEFARCQGRYLWIIIKQIAFIVICSLFSFALTLRAPMDFIILFFAIQILADIIAKKLLDRRTGKKHRKRISILSSVSSILIILILLVCFLQSAIESYNKRFTYIHAGNSDYIVLTTFQDNFITIESEVNDDSITIYRGHVRLISITDSVLSERQFSKKTLK